ncbi:MAG: hypothetical protein AAB966_03395 [Patescibacteria group bacterium]
MLILIILYIAAEPTKEGQEFMGYKYQRLQGKKYSHSRKRKRFSDGKYHYFED